MTFNLQQATSPDKTGTEISDAQRTGFQHLKQVLIDISYPDLVRGQEASIDAAEKIKYIMDKYPNLFDQQQLEEIQMQRGGMEIEIVPPTGGPRISGPG